MPRRFRRTHSLSSSRSPDRGHRSIGSTLLALPLILAFTPPAARGSEGHEVPAADLVINEIMKDPVVVSDTHGEYVEIYNASSFSVDLNGWTIRDLGGDEHAIDAGEPLLVEAGGYVVLARDTSTANNGGFVADYEYAGFTLSNGADEVILVNPGGFVVDSVGYDSTDYPDQAGSALELRNPGFDNVPGVNWRCAAAPFGLGDYGTPGAENSAWEAYKVVTLDAGTDTLEAGIGGIAELEVILTAQGGSPAAVILYGDLRLPGGDEFPNNPLFGPARFEIPPGEQRLKTLSVVLNERVEVGDYRLEGHLRAEGEEIDREDVIIRVSAGRDIPARGRSWTGEVGAREAMRPGTASDRMGE